MNELIDSLLKEQLSKHRVKMTTHRKKNPVSEKLRKKYKIKMK